MAWKPDQFERNRFVGFRTTYMFDRFIDLPRDTHLNILDFGCGEGHSINVLLDMYPNAHFVGADISSAGLSTLVAHFGKNPRINIVEMANPFATEGLGRDYEVIQLNALPTSIS
jgi:trans-aconitate methyltransferase